MLPIHFAWSQSVLVCLSVVQEMCLWLGWISMPPSTVGDLSTICKPSYIPVHAIFRLKPVLTCPRVVQELVLSA